MVNDLLLKQFLINGELFFRHRNVLKSMGQVKVLNWLAGDEPHGCNVGNII